MSFNGPNYQRIPIEDAYEIFREKCVDEGINPPTFEVFKERNLRYRL